MRTLHGTSTYIVYTHKRLYTHRHMHMRMHMHKPTEIPRTYLTTLAIPLAITLPIPRGIALTLVPLAAAALGLPPARLVLGCSNLALAYLPTGGTPCLVPLVHASLGLFWC
jgi:hypothetical protein